MALRRAIVTDDLIGIPFKNKGYDASEGFDCQGLVVEVLNRFGAMVEANHGVDSRSDKQITEEVDRQLFSQSDPSTSWAPIEQPEPGCIVLMKTTPGPWWNHVGIYLDEGRFIHTYKASGGVVINRLTEPLWKNRIQGFYKWTGKTR